MPSVTSNSPWMAVSWLCRHRLGWAVSGQSPSIVRGYTSASYTTLPSAAVITPGSRRAIRPRFAFSKSVRSVRSAGTLPPPRHEPVQMDRRKSDARWSHLEKVKAPARARAALDEGGTVPERTGPVRIGNGASDLLRRPVRTAGRAPPLDRDARTAGLTGSSRVAPGPSPRARRRGDGNLAAVRQPLDRPLPGRGRTRLAGSFLPPASA